MLKNKINVMIVTLMVAMAIPGMAFALEEVAINPSLNVSTGTESISSGTESISSGTESISSVENAALINAGETSAATPLPSDGKVAEPDSAKSDSNASISPEVPEAEVVTEAEVVPQAPEVVPEAGVVTEVKEVVVQAPEVVTPVIEVPKESTLIIHHQFVHGDVVCDDYETVVKLPAGSTVKFGEYSYENKHAFVNCTNGSDSIQLQEGENSITIKYTLKAGYKIV